MKIELKKEDLVKIKSFEDIVFLAIRPSFLDKFGEDIPIREEIRDEPKKAKKRGRPKKPVEEVIEEDPEDEDELELIL